MKTLTDTYADRFNKRSLPELLVHKFLTKYGYAHGPLGRLWMTSWPLSSNATLNAIRQRQWYGWRYVVNGKANARVSSCPTWFPFTCLW